MRKFFYPLDTWDKKILSAYNLKQLMYDEMPWWIQFLNISLRPYFFLYFRTLFLIIIMCTWKAKSISLNIVRQTSTYILLCVSLLSYIKKIFLLMSSQQPRLIFPLSAKKEINIYKSVSSWLWFVFISKDTHRCLLCVYIYVELCNTLS